MCQVKPEQRSRAKQLAYGLLYGMGKPALASTLKTDLTTAGNLASAFKASLPGVTVWIAREQDRCRHATSTSILGFSRNYSCVYTWESSLWGATLWRSRLALRMQAGCMGCWSCWCSACAS